MLYKDSANRKSNQQNLGTIKSSNLCTGALRIVTTCYKACACTPLTWKSQVSPLRTEIIEYSSPEETAVCNLASIALPRFVRESEPHGREGRKLVGSLDAANRSSKGGSATSRAVSSVVASPFCIYKGSPHSTYYFSTRDADALPLYLSCMAGSLISTSLQKSLRW